MAIKTRFLLRPLAAALLALSASHAFAFADADTDGMDDQWEQWWGLNPADPADAALDNDADSLTNLQEYTAELNPQYGDTDGDEVSDLDDNFPTNKLHAYDTDSDTMPDGWELAHALNHLSNTDAADNYDGDTLTNLQEFQLGTDPQLEDSDLDGQKDGLDFRPLDPAYTKDTDADGMPDEFEDAHPPLDKNNNGDGTGNLDADGLTNVQEFQSGTLINQMDTDGDSWADHIDLWPTQADYTLDTDSDGLPDEWEWEYGLNDADPEDANMPFFGEADFITPLDEFKLGTSPLTGDSDLDYQNDLVDFEPTVAHIYGDEDTDLDGIPGWWEVAFSMSDTNASSASSDSDNDGWTALQEYQRSTWPDIANDNSLDHDLMPDSWEMAHGLNVGANDGLLDPDADGLNNNAEYKAGTDPQVADSDHDGFNDGMDIWPADARYRDDNDNDGMPNEWEDAQDPPLDKNSPADASMDADYDTLTNLQEFLLGTNPNNVDTDGSGQPDNTDQWPTDANYSMDSDNDGLPDEWETEYYLDPYTALDAIDIMVGDNDRLSPLQEFVLGTNPNTNDTDIDGYDDRHDFDPLVAHMAGDIDVDLDGIPMWWEAIFSMNPSLATDGFSDADGDTATALQEFQRGSYPDIAQDTDDDNDGMPNGWEAAHGLNTTNNDSNLDADADGLTNEQEYLAGTDPQRMDSDGDDEDDSSDPWPKNSAYSLDTDGDGMPDEWEDAQTPFLDKNWAVDATIDNDYDSLTNVQEFLLGTNHGLTDTDNDGIMDNVDPWPTNQDYYVDTDGDGLPDNWESNYGLNPNLASDASDMMFGDNDLLSPLQEFLLGTDPNNADSDVDGFDDRHDFDPIAAHFAGDRDQDFDGIPQWWELAFSMSDTNASDANQDGDADMATNLQEYLRGTWPDIADDQDADFDGMLDGWELAHGLSTGYNDGNMNFDGDTLNNRQEFMAGTDPWLMDSDRDGMDDSTDPWPADERYNQDFDDDGMPDTWEDVYAPDLDKYYDGDATDDSDGDGLTNLQEFLLGANPLNSDSDNDGMIDDIDPWPTNSAYTTDTDGDGLPDEWEMDNGFDAYDAWDANDIEGGYDGDKLSPLQEFLLGTKPSDDDSDGDGYNDREDFDPLVAHLIGDEDQDFDGIPQWWEQAFGMNDWNANDAFDDMDGDQASALQEYQRGTYPDIMDDMDDDNDGIPNGWEMAHGINPYSNNGNQDDDGDNLTNLQEYHAGTEPYVMDTDGDGMNDGMDKWPTNAAYSTDTDNDGLPDAYEMANAPLDKYYPDDANDPWLFDSDQLSPLQEFALGTNPTENDSDGDYTDDDMDLWPTNAAYAMDSDNDGLPDEWEWDYGLDPYSAWDANELLFGDDDNLSPLQEFTLGTDPYQDDTDNDFFDDRHDIDPFVAHWNDVDNDFDGIPYWWEQAFGIGDWDAYNASSDYDADGVSALQEYQRGTSPDIQDDVDTDRDSMPDGWEMAHGLNPNNNSDRNTDLDADGLSNSDEFQQETDPGMVDSDLDGVNDGNDPWPGKPDYSLDTDSDGMPDNWEDTQTPPLDKNWAADANQNNDGDTLNNRKEFEQGSNPYLTDSDSDGFADDSKQDLWPANVNWFDSDTNGLPDQWETANFGYPISKQDANDPMFGDNDQLSPMQELELGTNPILSDSDMDSSDDRHDQWPTDVGYQNDDDFDGMPSEWEMTYVSTPLNLNNANDGVSDGDGDGLTNLQEFRFGSAPNATDSDGDTINDNTEVFTTHTHPGLSDTDGDGRADNTDTFPTNAAEWVDTDSDGTGNNADTDDDGDSYADNVDAYPLDPNQHDGNFIYPLNSIYKGSTIKDVNSFL